jgi:hypothetical protein
LENHAGKEREVKKKGKRNKETNNTDKFRRAT